MPEKNQILKHL